MSLSSGFLMAFIATAMFSSKSILIKWAYSYGVDSTSLLTWRMIFSAPLYLFIFVYLYKKDTQDKPTTSQLLPVALLGVIGYYLASWLDLTGLNYISAHFERLVLFTYPVFVLIFNAIANKQWIKPQEALSFLLAYLGLGIIFNIDFQEAGSSIILGSSLVLASAFCYAIYVVGSQKYSRQIGSKYFTCIGMLAASLAIFVHFICFNDLADLKQDNMVLLIAFSMAIFATVIPSFLMNAAIAKIGGNKTAILGSAGPVLTTLFAITFLQESLSLLHFIGMALVLIGVWLLSKVKNK